MSMAKTETKKSIIYKFDGYSEFYRAYVSGAFKGTYVVPKRHAHLVQAFGENLAELHRDRRYGITLRGAGRVF